MVVGGKEEAGHAQESLSVVLGAGYVFLFLYSSMRNDSPRRYTVVPER